MNRDRICYWVFDEKTQYHYLMVWRSEARCGFVKPPNQYCSEAYAVSYIAKRRSTRYCKSAEKGMIFVAAIAEAAGWQVLSPREVNLL